MSRCAWKRWGLTDSFRVLGRGELQLAILIETMREGYELMVGNRKSSSAPKTAAVLSRSNC